MSALLSVYLAGGFCGLGAFASAESEGSYKWYDTIPLIVFSFALSWICVGFYIGDAVRKAK